MKPEDDILGRFDLTDPKLQREIVANFAVRCGIYAEALQRIAGVEVRPGDVQSWPGKGLVGCRDAARAALDAAERSTMAAEICARPDRSPTKSAAD